MWGADNSFTSPSERRGRPRGRLSLLLLIAIPTVSTSASAQVQVTGSVQDQSGAVISGAAVTLKSEHSSLTVSSAPNGGFSFAGVLDTTGTIRVTADGFAAMEQKWSANSNVISLDLVLKPLSIGERITVSATR
ncbi:MAG: hypothetical protein DMG97_07470, partial [Acidobacteria bacterium]